MQVRQALEGDFVEGLGFGGFFVQCVGVVQIIGGGMAMLYLGYRQKSATARAVGSKEETEEGSGGMP